MYTLGYTKYKGCPIATFLSIIGGFSLFAGIMFFVSGVFGLFDGDYSVLPLLPVGAILIVVCFLLNKLANYVYFKFRDNQLKKAEDAYDKAFEESMTDPQKVADVQDKRKFIKENIEKKDNKTERIIRTGAWIIIALMVLSIVSDVIF